MDPESATLGAESTWSTPQGPGSYHVVLARTGRWRDRTDEVGLYLVGLWIWDNRHIDLEALLRRARTKPSNATETLKAPW